MKIPKGNLARKNDITSSAVGSGEETPSGNIASTSEGKKILLSVVHELLAELNALFERAAEKKYVYRELVLSQQTHLKNYGRIKNSSFQAGINTHIIQQSLEPCNVTIDDTDIQQILQ